MPERFLVTGALGCIGAWTVKRLVDEGVPVWTYDLDVYGLGDDGGGGLKVGGHAIGADVDPDDAAARVAPPAEVERLVAAARRRLPLVELGRAYGVRGC